MLLVSLVFCAYLTAMIGVSAYYFRKGSPEAVQTAMKWDPYNPRYYDAMGTLLHLYADEAQTSEIVHFYQQATRLSPYDAQHWSNLAEAYDWAGRPDAAFDAFRRARLLFPNSPEINWRLANFCVRSGKLHEGLSALHVILADDHAAHQESFALAERAGFDLQAVLTILPSRAGAFFDLLNFEIRTGNIAGADKVWDQILRSNLKFNLQDASPYLDELIRQKELGRLAQAWSALAVKFPEQLEHLQTMENLIANGSFEFDILNGGFDWRVVPTDGATVSLDSDRPFEGSRALRILFDGSQNLNYGHVFQYVPVQPSTHYRFTVHLRADDITSDSGPRFQIYDAYRPDDMFVSTGDLRGTTGWLEQRAEFTTKPNTHLLLVRLARPPSTNPDGRVRGGIWVDSVSLKAKPQI